MALLSNNTLNNITTAIDVVKSQYSVKDFLGSLSKLPPAITSQFEAHFSLIPDVALRVVSVSIPAVTTEFSTLYIDNRPAFFPTRHDNDHDMTLTVINDEQNNLYSAFRALQLDVSDNQRTAFNGAKLVIKILQSNTNPSSTEKLLDFGAKVGTVGSAIGSIANGTTMGYVGSVRGAHDILINNVRVQQVGNLNFNYSGGDILTFDVTFKVGSIGV